MGVETGIAWTDSTSNPWHGCTKVDGAQACIHCYAEGVNKRAGGGNWGHGAPRRLTSEHNRNEPYRWQKKADQFEAEHGRRRRVFTLSMGDLFDNEVPNEWRLGHMKVMEETDRLDWQICTKRAVNIPKMVPAHWKPDVEAPRIPDGISIDKRAWEQVHSRGKLTGGELKRALLGKPNGWPRHIGVLITVVTQKEADRDIPRLLKIKHDFGIPWVGASYEPAHERIDFSRWLGRGLDWVIFGGKSGPRWRDGDFDIAWAYETRDACAANHVAFFMKQVAAFNPTDDMIPADLMVRQWPEWER